MELEQLEKKLNDLPRPTLSRLANFKFYLRLLPLVLKRWAGFRREAFSFSSLTTKLAATLVALVLLLAGSSGYAYFSPRVTYGQMLYPLKTTLEQLRVALARTPLDQVVIFTDLANRRLNEARVLANEKNDSAASLSLISAAEAAGLNGDQTPGPLTITVNEIINNTNKAIKASENIETAPVANQALALIDQAQTNHNSGLQEIARIIGFSAKPLVIETVARALNQTKINHQRVKTALDEVQTNLTQGSTEIKIKIKTAAEEENEKIEQAKSTSDSLAAEETSSDLTVELEGVKEKIDSLKEKISLLNLPANETQKLFDLLDKKSGRIEDSLSHDSLDKAFHSLGTLDALVNNVDDFIKEENRAKEIKNEDEVDLEEEKINQEDSSSWPKDEADNNDQLDNSRSKKTDEAVSNSTFDQKQPPSLKQDNRSDLQPEQPEPNKDSKTD